LLVLNLTASSSRLCGAQFSAHHAVLLFLMSMRVGAETLLAMTPRRRRILVLIIGATVLAVALVAVQSQLPSAGAGGLLHPGRRRGVGPRPPMCDDVVFVGEGVKLIGWRCHASTPRRGTLIYLHGTGDNHTSGAGIVERFAARGFDVLAYDSRAQGESEGEVCTYGFFEKHDLHRVIDTSGAGPFVLVGTSLGAAVALQEAAIDSRVIAVIAAETFSDLRTVATERAPFFFTPGAIGRAFQLAEQQGHFDVDAVSPVIAAAHITVPVLLIHGAADVDTAPDHSRRVLAALAGPKRLILVPGARHNESLRGEVWGEVERWLDGIIEAGRPL